MHNDAFGEWESSLNTKLIHIPYTLNIVWGFLLSHVDMLFVCSGGACVTSRVWRSEDGPESFSFHCFEVLRFKHRLPSLICQRFTYWVIWLALARPSLYSIVLAYMVSVWGQAEEVRCGFFFSWVHYKLWIWEFGIGSDRLVTVSSGTAAYFSSWASCSLQYPQFVTRIKQAS